MRILKVTQTYYPYLSKGGPPAKVRAIARALAQRGHAVTVLTADRGEANGASHAASIRTNAARSQSEWGWELAEGGVRAIYLPTLKSYRATTVNPRVWSFCARQLPNYDMVHIYGLYDLLGSVIGWFCRRRGIPYVLEPLGMFGPKIRSQRKKNLYRKLIGNSLFAGAHSLIATSENERSELIAGGIDESKIVLRRNGININEYETLPRRGQFRAKHGIGVDKRLIVFIGRLSFIKALDLLVKAFAQLDSDAYLVIAGPDDEDGCAREIQELIEEFQLRRQVILTGPLYNNEKLQAFVDADFVVLPSRYESFGNVAAESIACGTPVLVTDQCGIASMVDGKAGLVVPCNAKSLQQGMKLLMEDKLLLARLRGRCAETAQDLSWDEPIAATEKLYEFLIARHDARVPRALTAKGDHPIET